ncbi:hypothetical protein LTR10_003777 [Elasticomyces elasticus]|nr:hypothetical protein LTR10_003777 [Elasticomyces elasticus]
MLSLAASLLDQSENVVEKQSLQRHEFVTHLEGFEIIAQSHCCVGTSISYRRLPHKRVSRADTTTFDRTYVSHTTTVVTTPAELPMAMSYTLAVFLIVLGCAVFIGLAWGVWSLLHGRQSTGAMDDSMRDPEQDQAVYMREVRLRNHEFLANAYGARYKS